MRLHLASDLQSQPRGYVTETPSPRTRWRRATSTREPAPRDRAARSCILRRTSSLRAQGGTEARGRLSECSREGIAPMRRPQYGVR